MKNKVERSTGHPTINEVFEKHISAKNKEFIQKFLDYKKGYITEQATWKYKYCLTKFADVLEKDFDQATKEEINKIGGMILQSDLATKTQQDMIGSIKCAYKLWFGDNEYYPKVVCGLKRPTSRTALKLPEDMLTEEQIYEMIKLAGNSRDASSKL